MLCLLDGVIFRPSTCESYKHRHSLDLLEDSRRPVHLSLFDERCVHPKEDDMNRNIIPNISRKRRMKAHQTREQISALASQGILDKVHSSMVVLVDEVFG